MINKKKKNILGLKKKKKKRDKSTDFVIIKDVGKLRMLKILNRNEKIPEDRLYLKLSLELQTIQNQFYVHLSTSPCDYSDQLPQISCA